MTRTHFQTCPLCEATCGLEITIDGGAITTIRGDADDVFSAGFLCPKAPALKALHEDPDRLRTPLVRRDGALRPSEWDEALAEVADRLQTVMKVHGRDAVGVYLGNPNVHTLAGGLYVRPLLKALRTRKIFTASTVDQIPKHVASGYMYGDPNRIAVPDIDRTDLLLMLGANPLASNGSLCTAPDFPGRLRALRERGGRLVVVDPRRTRTARVADTHLFIRPGTDSWLLCGLISALFDSGQVDLGRLASHVTGLGTIRTAVADLTPEVAAARCGIDAHVIRRLATDLANADSAAVYGRLGTQTVRYGTVAAWAVDVLNLVTGNLDRPGGAMFARPAHLPEPEVRARKGFAIGRWKSHVKGYPEVRGELPCTTLVDEILDGGDERIRALITIAGNPVVSVPGGPRLANALTALDFMVSVDPYVNETTCHADVVLPSPSPLQRAHYDLAFYGLAVRNVANYSPPALPREAEEGPSESEVIARLAMIAAGAKHTADPGMVDAMILNALVGWGAPRSLIADTADRQGPERLLDFLLRAGPYDLCLADLEASPHGIDLGALTPMLPQALETRSGTIELAAEPILADLAKLSAGEDAPCEGLVLIGRRHLRSNNSWMRNLPRLVAGQGRCDLLVHPETAAEHHLRDGARAVLSGAGRELTVRVSVTEDVMPAVVCLPHGWSDGTSGARLQVAAAHPGVCSNDVIDPSALDPLSGNAVLNGVPVTLRAL